MNKSDCVRVYFEIGHEASLRSKRTIEGFTHDWEVFVRGADNADIHHFVDKVVFHLHDTFPKPKRTIKEPPYCLKESGYAGFNLPIDIYLKSKDEHRRIRFYYDLTLQSSGPRIANLIKEKTDFANPPEDFRRKLIRGGGVGVGNDSTSIVEKINNNTPNSHGDDSKSSPHSGKPKLNNITLDQPKKHKQKEASKPEETRGTTSFAALFGTPIKTNKHSPTSKPATKTSSSSEIKNSHEKQAKDSSKISKHSPHKDKEKDKENSLNKYKEKERDREKDEKLNKEKDRNKEYKDKDKIKDKIPKKSLSPVPPKDVRKEENVKKPPEENTKDRISSKSDSLKEKKHKEKKHKEERERKENHKEHDKKEIDKDKINEKIDKKLEIPRDKEIKFKTFEKEEKKSKQDKEKDRNHDSEKHKHKHKRKEKHKKEDEKDRRKKRPREKTPEPIPPPKIRSPTPPSPLAPVLLSTAPVKPTTINPLNMLIQELSDKDSDSDFSVGMDEDTKSDPPLELLHRSKMDVQEERERIKKRDKKNRDEDRECRKRKKRTKDKDEPFEKNIKTEIKEELRDISPKREERSESPDIQFTDDYVTQLKDLQQKIMTLQDNAELQRVVQVISETGHFEITQRTFDFDLCALDRSTVKRLQDMFITAS